MPENAGMAGEGRFFEAVFFDLGNTLIYSEGEFMDVSRPAALAMIHALQQQCCAVDEASFLEDFSQRLADYYREREADFIEDTTEFVLRSLLFDYGFKDLPHPILRAALDEMYRVTRSRWHAEEDAIPTLRVLKEQGYRIGLISNAADAKDVYELVEQTGLRPYLDPIIISAEAGMRKPHPRIFELALKPRQIDPSRAVMVGDTLNADIRGARNYRMASVWVTRRADTAENRALRSTILPDASIGMLSELPALLAGWQQSGMEGR